MAKLLIYGATGYTGKMLSRLARERGIDFAVGGRDSAKVGALAAELGVRGQVFGVDDESALRAALEDVRCVLNVAGPFSATAAAVIAACLATGTHYLDTTGELAVFSHAERLDVAAIQADVMLMPGVGWDVVPSDCIALHVARRVDGIQKLRIGLAHKGGIPSRGTLRTGMAIMAGGTFLRRDGKLLKMEGTCPSRILDFGFARLKGALTPMGDLVTGYKSTGAPNIEVYSAASEALVLPDGGIEAFPEGPTREQLDMWQAFVAAEAVGADGRIARSVIQTVSGYDFTASAGIAIAEHVLAGRFKPGFQSPASAYGVELATALGATIKDLD